MARITPADCLRDWLQTALTPTAFDWLRSQCELVATGNVKSLFLAFGFVPRKTGKELLRFDAERLRLANDARPLWNPAGWSVDQAARTLLLLQLPAPDETTYIATLDKLFAAGEVGELVALYQSLPLLPHPTAHVWRARECVRTNMKSVFCALAHHNPYPSEQMDEPSWNQMILKCLFIGAALDPVIGIEERSNAALVRMLTDYAHERWAAKRVVCPELWRPITLFADDVALKDLHRVLTTGEVLERQAAALTLSRCPHPRAKEILAQEPELARQVAKGEVVWSQIAERAYS